MSARQIDSFRSVPTGSCPTLPASWRASAGQATVELVGLLPLLVAVGFGVFSALAAAKAEELASSAAEAGAIALLQEHDAEEAARSALPGWSRREAHIRVDGRRVTVRVQPRGPVGAINDRLTASVTADAGPEARP
jgi:Flp pilus assembly protein TadG